MYCSNLICPSLSFWGPKEIRISQEGGQGVKGVLAIAGDGPAKEPMAMDTSGYLIRKHKKTACISLSYTVILRNLLNLACSILFTLAHGSKQKLVRFCSNQTAAQHSLERVFQVKECQEGLIAEATRLRLRVARC